jgi:site-specific DNA-cytosine methylase
MRAIGLLCGVGSLLREAQDAGFSIVGNFETRPQYRTGLDLSWELNFHDIPFRSSLEAVEHDSFFHEADLAIGHPPCGSHSQLGNSSARLDSMSAAERQAYFTRRDSHMGLLPLFVDEVNRLKPRAFMLDNLPKILRTAAPETWWRKALPKYHLTFIVMTNWHYGTPQLRERLWVVGVRKPGKPFVFTEPKTRLAGPATTWAAISDLPWQPWENVPEIGHVHVGVNRMLTGDYRTTTTTSVTHAAQLGLGFLSIPADRLWPYTTKTGRVTYKIGRQRLDCGKRSRVLTGLPSLHHPLTGWPLTPRERARLMDWPDDFHLGSEETTYDRRVLMRLTLFTGKAVPSGFPRYILPRLYKHLRR